MAAIDNLFAQFAYPAKKTDLPVLIFVHGWSGDANTIGWVDMQRLAERGFFVGMAGMRGRNDADGARDASAKEIYDLYDLLIYIRANYAAVVSSDRAVLFGLSGGGGNALAGACKFPDTWAFVVDYFGMSDYGRNNPDGWYYNNGGTYTDQIVTAIGDTPANLPNNYYARDATVAITNYTGGHLVMAHDNGDPLVPVIHSDRIKTILDAASMTNYTYFRSINGTYAHTTRPSDRAGLLAAEDTWAPLALAAEAWTVPASGTLQCIGYLKTKRFEMRLGDLDDHAATVVYGATADTYTVTPLTGEVSVTITQADAKTVTQTINAETALVVV
jgi:pimeloyl-ACP methyl ester carboxylesterase